MWPSGDANLRDDLRVSCDEVLAPLVGLTPFEDTGVAIDAVAGSEFGQRAGLFTHDQRVAYAIEEMAELKLLTFGNRSSA